MKRSTLPRNFPPPPLPKRPEINEPDYEVIDFGGQQYSNTPMKPATGMKVPSGIKCELCGKMNAILRCEQCMSHTFCANCDEMYHRHPKRLNHNRKKIEIEQPDKPPLPPKGELLNIPKPPPRRGKSRFLSASPLPSPNLSQRSGNSGRSDNQDVQKPVASLPSWATFKGKSSTLTRPLPPPPSGHGNQKNLSRPVEPAVRTSVFDSIKRPPSVTMEKIKSTTAAALDRMVQLQQRYRQHQETMKSDSSRRSSTQSDLLQVPSGSSLNGSISSGMDSISFKPPQPPRFDPQTQQRNFSSSVFNVNHQPVPQRPINPWTGTPQMMNQAQSMAQLNFNSQWNPAAAMAQQQQMWMQQQRLNGSNMSLNMPSSQGFGFEDPWNQQGWGSMFPFPYPYPAPNSMTLRPPSRTSRQPPRAASPALSTRSRRSVTSQRRAPPVPLDVTDDEDSDEEFHHGRHSKGRREAFNARRGRKMSTQSNFEFPIDAPDSDKANSDRNRGRFTKSSAKNYRGGSVARSLHDYPVSRRDKSPNSVPSSDEEQDTLKRRQQKKEEPVLAEMAVQTYGEIGRPIEPEPVKEVPKPVLKEVPGTVKPLEAPPKPQPVVHEMSKEWECKHCTYVNDPGTRICGVCCKTAEVLLTESPPPSPTSQFKRGAGDFDFDGIEKELAVIPAQKEKLAEDDDNQSVNSDKIEKEILEKIEAFAASQKKLTHLSMGVGTSPPPSVVGEPKAPKIEIEADRKTTGTSPPPQSISTQTYEPVVFKEHEPPKLTSEQLSPNSLRRSQSISLGSSRVQSQSSKSPRELSPLSFHHERINSAAMDLQDLYLQQMNQGQNLNKSYKSVSDLNYNDAMWNIRRGSQMNDSGLRSQDIARLFSDRSLTNLASLKDLVRETENKRVTGPEMINLLRQAEMHKYTTEELQAALSHCGDANPITWLRENWSRLIETVQTLATKYGHRRPENTVGTISSIEAREALRLHKGDVWQAVTECIQQRQRKYNELAIKGNFSREDIVTSLTAHHGNVELALIELSKSQMKPFMMNIWGPPSEIENESGNIIIESGISDLPNLVPNSDVMIDLMLDEMEKLNNNSNKFPANVIGIDSPEMIQSSFKRAAEMQSILRDDKPQIDENLLNDLKVGGSTEDLNSSIASSHSNGNLLRDIESLIQNLEENQSRKNEDLMKNIEGLFSSLLQKEMKVSTLDMPYQLNRKSPIPPRSEQKKDILVIAMEDNPTETSMDHDTSSVSQYSEALDDSNLEERDVQPEFTAEEVQNWLEQTVGRTFETHPVGEVRRRMSEKEDSPIVIPQATALEGVVNFFAFPEPREEEPKVVVEREPKPAAQNQEPKAEPQRVDPKSATQILEELKRARLEDELKATSQNNEPTLAEIQTTEGSKQPHAEDELKQAIHSATQMDEPQAAPQKASPELEPTSLPQREELGNLPHSEELESFAEIKETFESLNKVEPQVTEKNQETLVIHSNEATNTAEAPIAHSTDQTSEKLTKETFETEETIQESPKATAVTAEEATPELPVETNIEAAEVQVPPLIEVAEPSQTVTEQPNSQNPEVIQEKQPAKAKGRHQKHAKPQPKETSSWFHYSCNKGSYVRNVSRYYKKALKSKKRTEIALRRESLQRVQQLEETASQQLQQQASVQVPVESPPQVPVENLPETNSSENHVEAPIEVIITHDSEPGPSTNSVPASPTSMFSVSDRESSDASPLREVLNQVIVKNVQKIDALDEAVTSLNESSPLSVSPAFDDKPSKHLSDMVENTQRLIKQMKEEINSDIATFNSGESEEAYSSSEWTEEWSEEVTGDEAPEQDQFGSAESVVSLFTDDEVIASPTHMAETHEIAEEESEASLFSEVLASPVPPLLETATESQIEEFELETFEEAVEILESHVFEMALESMVESEELTAVTTQVEVLVMEPPVPEKEASPVEASEASSVPTSARSTVSKSPDRGATLKPSNGKKTKAAPIASSESATSDRSSVSKSPDRAPKSGAKRKGSLQEARKSSISGPFGSLTSSNVRNIQEKLEMNNFYTTKPSKPSKLVPPKIITGNSVSSLAKKIGSKTDVALKGESSKEVSKPNPRPGPSTSKIPVFQIPKKKYMETCFSDEYQSTDDEEDYQKAPHRQIRTLVSMESIERRESTAETLKRDADLLFQEGEVQNYLQAELAAYLMSCNFEKKSSLWAASMSSTLEEALTVLQDDCELCTEKYPMNEMVSMLKCEHKCCKHCAKNYYTIQITERSIGDCTCPFCKVPDMHDPDIHEDEVLEYFSNLDIVLKNILDGEVHELFQRKLRDRVLMQDPNFKWCVQCSSGCFVRKGQRRVMCPDCGSITCAQCRKQWEAQHDGLTCDQFTEWKEANDPERAAESIAKHLQINGIDCPKCKFKYSLARGGCMHFTCTQCKHEFCYGCGKPFKMGAKCKVSPYCARLGLHSHHPRNCLFYLRDKEPHELQSLLKMHEVKFETESIETLDSENSSNPALCPIPLQKETPTGMEDTVCKGDVAPGHAGLCKTHYVEYLVSIVSKSKVDPLPILDLTDCVQELRRRGIPLPERGPWDTDPIYREMCQKIVQAQIPLN